MGERRGRRRHEGRDLRFYFCSGRTNDVAVKVALAQINTTVGELRGNAAKILRFYEDAARRGAQLVVFPELAVTGYPPRDLVTKKRFVVDNLATLEQLAAQ